MRTVSSLGYRRCGTARAGEQEKRQSNPHISTRSDRYHIMRAATILNRRIRIRVLDRCDYSSKPTGSTMLPTNTSRSVPMLSSYRFNDPSTALRAPEQCISAFRIPAYHSQLFPPLRDSLRGRIRVRNCTNWTLPSKPTSVLILQGSLGKPDLSLRKTFPCAEKDS